MKKKFKFYHITVIGVVFLVTLIFLLPADALQQSQFDYINLPALENYQKEGHPKLESVLYRLAQVYSHDGPEQAKAFASMRGIDVDGDFVRVVLEAQTAGIGEWEATLAGKIVKWQVEGAGGRVETSFRQSVQGRVPFNSLLHLANLESVRFIRRPFLPHLTETSEGVAATGANKWHMLTPYHAQDSPKVCILDAGFENYPALLGTELPASVTTKSFRADGSIFAGQKHGAGCAEIVHDMAPNAELLLVNFQTSIELQNALIWILQQDVDIISFSMGSYIGGRGDGTGPMCELVEFAYNSGVTWVTSAGNAATDHWQGDFYDSDSDKWHNFSGGDEILHFYVPGNTITSAYLKWDDWGTWNGSTYSGSNQDYDLYLYYYDGANWHYVDKSSNNQTGTQWPYEILNGWYSSSSAWWGIAIYKYNATKNLTMDLFIPTHSGDLEYNVPEGSLTSPSDSPYIIAVGAVDWSGFDYHSYSSRGPTLDGRIKPDLCAPSGISCVSYGSGNFYGTSASCPHVAGALALLMLKTPFDLGEVKSIIEGRAEDLGPTGKDNQYGLGRLKLD